MDNIIKTAAGYDCGSVDGIAGAKTCTAIRTYQRDHGLVAVMNFRED